MLHGHRLHLLAAFCALSCLAGCGSGTYSSSSGAADNVSSSDTGNAAPVTSGFKGGNTILGSSNRIDATAAVGDTVTATVGATRNVSVIFTSNDARAITGFAVSGTLGSLPTGWSGPAHFSCASVSTGSGCVLNLTYAPTALDHGTLTLSYVFVANSAQPQTGGTLAIPYEATSGDNIVATPSPTGQIDAVIGRGSQSVSVNFTTDDGKAATQLVVTSDLSAYPGWTISAACPAQAIISTGSGCQMVLNYAPTAPASGVVKLNYSFIDATGTPKTGSLNIPFSATAANNVAATASPTGQILAVQNTAGQAVVIAFNTDDGKPASGLFVTSDLAALPAGWTSAVDHFSCGSVGTGNGCLLHLTYAPTALTPGTLTLTYVYKDGAGTDRNGLLNVAYAGTTNDVVIGTESPASQINAVITDGGQIGNGVQSVSVAFATGDGRPATALHLIAGTTPIPDGWSYDGAFACVGLDVDSVCSLPLSYSPTLAGSGTLLLNYAYINNAGEPKTGSVDIAYRATTNDNVIWTANPAPLGIVRTGSTTPLTVTFATDDGNVASSLSMTGLGALPAGWTSTSDTFSCSNVSTGAGCALPLTYAPTVSQANATLSLGYSYLNNAGYPATGTVTINYAAYTPYLYVVNAGLPTISSCAVNFDDSLAACTATGSGFSGAQGIALSDRFAYVTNAGSNSVSQCALSTDGSLNACSATGGGFAFTAPTHIAVNATNTYAYVGMSTGLAVCSISPVDGSLSGCIAASAAFDPLYGIVLSGDGALAYSVHLVDPGDPANSPTIVNLCQAAGGALSNCLPTVASTPHADATLGIHENHLYIAAQSALLMCPINTGSTITSCQTMALGAAPLGLAFSGETAFIGTGSSAIASCPVNANGTLGACTLRNDATFLGTTGLAVR
jgi:hypothetical protein